MSMIAGESKWAPSIRRGLVRIMERTQVGIALGDFINLCLSRGSVPWISLKICKSLLPGLICI